MRPAVSRRPPMIGACTATAVRNAPEPSDWAAASIEGEILTRLASTAWSDTARNRTRQAKTTPAIVPVSNRPVDMSNVDRIQESSVLSKRSEEQTSELQYLMRTTYAVFCLK